MELDAGAAVSVIPKKEFRAKFENVKIWPPDIDLHTYSGEALQIEGYAWMNVKYDDQTYTLKLYVVPKGKSILFGHDWSFYQF